MATKQIETQTSKRKGTGFEIKEGVVNAADIKNQSKFYSN